MAEGRRPIARRGGRRRTGRRGRRSPAAWARVVGCPSARREAATPPRSPSGRRFRLRQRSRKPGIPARVHSRSDAIMSQPTTRVNPSEESIRIGPLGIRFLLTGDDSGGSASVFEFTVPAGQRLAAPAHKNDAYEEVVYGLEGVLTWTVDGTPIEVGPGQTLCIRRGAVHRFDNLGSEDAKQLTLITPAIMGPAYFREAAEVIGAARGGPPDRARMTDVFRRHGMTLAAPPPEK